MRTRIQGFATSLAALGLATFAGVAFAAAPIANPDSATTPAGVNVVIPVMANDSDPDGNSITVSAISSKPANGSASRYNNQITYRPNAGFSGTDTLRYRLKDSTNLTAFGTVTITVTPPLNKAPVAGADSASTTSPNAVTVNLLANDTDADGNTLSVTANTAPANGTVTRTGGSATYTPAAGFSGTDTFSYTLSDGKGGSDSGSVSIAVAPKPNTPPVAGADSASTTSPNAVTVNLLANDADADADALTVTANTAPANGTVTRTGGSATYTPAAGFSGSNSFTYTISDGKGGTATASVTVSVAQAPAPAVVTGSAVLNWSIPTTRADSSPLTMAEIAGYEIYVLSESTGQSSVINVPSGATSTYTVSGLAADTYYFSMAAKDTAGNLSALSAVVSKTIAPK